MAIKIFKRTNAKDVFDEVTDSDDPPETDSALDEVETLDNTMQPDPEEPAELPMDEAEDDPEMADTANAADDSDEADDDEAPSPSRRRRWLRRILAATAGVVFVAAMGSSGYLGWQIKAQHDNAAAGRAALAVAQNYGVILTSIDTNGIDQNFNQVLDGATGEFKDMYSQSASQLRQILIDNKAMAKGMVIDSAIKSATNTKVEVLLFIDQTISNSVNPEPRIDRSRVAMTMELVDNRWLASKVDIK